MQQTSVMEVPTVSIDQSIDTNDEKTPLPRYLEETYWWAYLHPNAVRLFERQWLVNLILWGNYTSLRDTALDEIGRTIRGNSLQVACVYGDFTSKVAARLEPGAYLDVIDVAPVQLKNLKNKLNGTEANVVLHHQDSTNLRFADGSYDNVIVFFLLHEQPHEVRLKTIEEALRVTKPNGKVVFVDYHRPCWNNPFRYLMVPILASLEPFALDLWKSEIAAWLPLHTNPAEIHKTTYFGSLYQKIVMIR